MIYPEWALKHKIKNSELRKRGNQYALYSITSRWCPEKKRTKKVTLQYLGSISEAHGFIPRGMKRMGRIPAGESPYKVPPATESKETNFMDDLAQLNDERSIRNLRYSVS